MPGFAFLAPVTYFGGMYPKIPIAELHENPDNPRVIRDEKFKKLVKSLREFPQMLEVRPIVVNASKMVLGGNMRLKAAKEAGLTAVPVAVAETWTAEQEREFIIKDNLGYGEWDWDALANQWDAAELNDWGLDIPAEWGEEGGDIKGDSTEIKQSFEIVVFCKNESEQQALFDQLTNQGYECQVSAL